MPRSEWFEYGGEADPDSGSASPPASVPASFPDGSPDSIPDFWAGGAERELSLAEAERRVRADTAALGWTARYRVLDPTEPTAVQCALWQADGAEVPYGLGSGKGGGRQARVGARFEALEHALSGPLALDRLPVRLRPAAALSDGPFGSDRAVRGVAEQSEAAVACLPYTGLDGGPDLDVPLFLWATWYLSRSGGMASRRARIGDDADYGPAMSYSGSTGCAIGASYDEAVLHAVNEWAERDALSLFLLRTVYDEGPMPDRIDPDRLPGPLGRYLERAERLLGGPVVLLDLTTDLGIPVVAAYAPERAGRLVSYGTGASLSGVTAIERALTEIVQGELLARVVRDRDGVPVGAGGPRGQRGQHVDGHPSFDELLAEHDIAAEVERRLVRYPKLLACARLELGDRIDSALPADLPGELAARGTSVAEQRAVAVSRIAAAGHRVLAYELRALPHGTSVVQVQCPGLERFQLITSGHLALPGPRGTRWRAVRT